MDKQTLSNYGWIVIAVLVLAVMIALATPFGQYVENAVWSTTEGLFEIQDKALNSAGLFTPPEKINENDVDLVVFAGQSNMSGRGTAAEATVCPTEAGYWYKNPTMNGQSKDTEGLYTITEPFGNEGTDQSTGSLVSAFAKEYYANTGCPIVAVSSSYGGTSITQWQSGQTYLDKTVQYIESAKTYLEAEGKNIRRTYMVWNQGETDANNGLSSDEYVTYFNSMWEAVKTTGIDNCFIINIGQYGSDKKDYSQIKLALSNVCSTNDVVMVSDKFTNANDFMKDVCHYKQIVYNAVGKDAGKNVASYYKGITPTITTFDAEDVFGEIDNYGTLEDWDYTTKGIYITLTDYKGSNPDVYVYEYYKLDGYIYKTIVKKNTGSNYTDACFYENTVIETVKFADGVTFENNGGNKQFYGATSLKRVINLPDVSGSSEDMFKGCTSLEELPDLTGMKSITRAFEGCENLSGNVILPNTITKMQSAFKETKITSVNSIPVTCGGLLNYAFANCEELKTVGDIDGTFTAMQYTFVNDTALESVGTIKCKTVTCMNNAFYGCTSLSGIIRIESTEVNEATNMLKMVDLSKIIIQVPADSTTYETIIAEYPTANIETF